MLNSTILNQQLEEQLKEEEVFLLFSKTNPVGSKVVFEDFDVKGYINQFRGVVKEYNYETLQMLVEEKYIHVIRPRNVKKSNL